MLEKWIQFIVRNRFKTVLLWLILTVIGGAAALNLDQYLTTSLTIPNSESAAAEKVLAAGFNENTEGTLTVLLNFKQATPEEIGILENRINLAAKVIPGSRISFQRAIGGVLITNISTPFDLSQAAEYTNILRDKLDQAGLLKAQVTGPPAIKSDVTPVMASDLHRGQLVAIFIALLLLILLLGFCFSVLVPFIFALATITTTLGIIYLIATKYLMVLYIPNIVELIGLGLAIDYSLLIQHRFRSALKNNESENEAIMETMRTAGRTVVISGLIVATGMTSLLLVPIPFVRSLGIAGALIPLVSILAAITLQPAMLSYLGHSGSTPTKFLGLWERQPSKSSLLPRITDLVTRKPLMVFLATTFALLIAATPLLSLSLTPSSMTALPKNLESAAALNWATDRAGAGATTPIAIIMDLGKSGAALTPQNKAARIDLANAISKNEDVFTVAGGEKTPYVDSTGRYLRILVISKSEFGSPKSQSLVREIREQYLPESQFNKNIPVYVGGAAAQGVDLIKKLKGIFPLIVCITLLIAYLLLAGAFKSLILPLKAIILDLLTTAVSYAAIVEVFKYGFASSILHTYRVEQIEAWVLIFIFAVLFGLTMDYEVFIVSRMREAMELGGSNKDAITEGLRRTIGVITAAAAIMFVAVMGLVGGHFAGLQELGVGLAVGVIIDATIIRMFLLPSTMVLLGSWNWWLPKYFTSQR
ncbi:MAG: MMPL family transporter [Candidatus Nanopelagicaceae bacterium]